MKFRTIKSYAVKALTSVFALLHPVEKKVLFSSFGGAQYSDNPRAISEKLHELYPDFKIAWAMHETSKACKYIPEYVDIVPARGWPFFKELATSFCFVTNTPLGESFFKRKTQFFIQTWHGDRGIKKVLYDTDPQGFGMAPIADGRITDLAICASDLGERVYRTAFRYNGKVLKEGSPRNDVLFSDVAELRKNIGEQYGVLPDSKILLYAPTFRDHQKQKQDICVDLKQVLQTLRKSTGENWVCFSRAHYISGGLAVSSDGKNIINVTDYPDMADLLACVDMLITDYSSSAGDFVLRNKAVILAMFDEQEYKDSCRDFVFQPEDAGFIVAKDQEELDKILQTYKESDYQRSCERVCKYFNVIETGKASERICHVISGEYARKIK